MKQKIIIEGKEKEFKLRDIDHLNACVKYHSTVTKNKKKYTRKEKHRKNLKDFV